MNFPERPAPTAPWRWVTFDPGGTKPTLAVVWAGAKALAFVPLMASKDRWWDTLDEAADTAFRFDCAVIENGFVGPGYKASLELERERGRLEQWALEHTLGPALGVLPDQWRAVLGLPARGGKKIIAHGMRDMCKRLARQLPGGTMPEVALAAKATNEDKRAALLIGVACLLQWRWV